MTTAIQGGAAGLRPRMQSTMRAARIVGPGHVEIVEAPLPEPGPGQVRVRVESCGVCGSNIPVWEGRPWFEYPLPTGAPGHEGCGRIDALGEGVTDLRKGQRVAMLSYAAFAEYDVADAMAVVPLPESLDGEPVPGEALGCAVNVFRRSEIKPRQTVAVMGVGFLGALVLQLAANAGARVLAISRRNTARFIARTLGASVTIPLRGTAEVLEQVREITGRPCCDVVIEAVGSQDAIDLASELVCERGRLVIAGYHQDGERRVNMQSWNWRGIDVINAHERSPQVYIEGMRAAVEHMAAGQLTPSVLYTHRFSLDRLGEALDAAQSRPEGFMKALVMMTP